MWAEPVACLPVLVTIHVIQLLSEKRANRASAARNWRKTVRGGQGSPTPHPSKTAYSASAGRRLRLRYNLMAMNNTTAATKARMPYSERLAHLSLIHISEP